MRNSLATVSLILAHACGGATTPAREGFAVVEGQVLLSSGSLLANSTVGIRCANGAVSQSVSTNASGAFMANLTAPASLMTGSTVNLLCDFGAPNLTDPLAGLQASIVFAPAGLRAPQAVILRQSP
jgi:hypothetical protein